MSMLTGDITELTDREFEKISDLVKNLCGINLHQGKKELVKARLNKRLRALNLSNFDDYIAHIRADASGDELITMLDAISTNLTSFFRENGHFEHLAQTVLPQIVANRAGARGRLRIWSAGCSSGEEPYTIAIVLHETIQDLAAWDAKILATDLSTKVLAKAVEGVFNADRLRGIPGAIVQRHFTCVQTKPERVFRVQDSLRRLISFARLNLLEAWPMTGPFDIIFCRNVMIYFDKPTQTRLIDRFWNLLGPAGILYVGHSESLAGVKHRFEYVRPTVYRKA